MSDVLLFRYTQSNLFTVNRLIDAGVGASPVDMSSGSSASGLSPY